MAVRDSFRDYILEQLGRVRPVTWRRMFGGVGLYADDRFFALLDNDTLFFKTGDLNRDDFLARRMEPFRPFGPGTKPMDYHELPGDVLENVSELGQWIAKAVAVTATTQKKKPAPKRPKAAPKRAGKTKGDRS